MWNRKRAKQQNRKRAERGRKPTFEMCENRQLMAADLSGAVEFSSTTRIDSLNEQMMPSEVSLVDAQGMTASAQSIAKPDLVRQLEAQDMYGNKMSHEEWMDSKLSSSDPHDFYEDGYDPDRPNIWS